MTHCIKRAPTGGQPLERNCDPTYLNNHNNYVATQLRYAPTRLHRHIVTKQIGALATAPPVPAAPTVLWCSQQIGIVLAQLGQLRGDYKLAIALIRVTRVVIMMIGLGFPKVGRRQKMRNDRLTQ